MAKKKSDADKLRDLLHSKIEEPRLDELVGAIIHAMGGTKGAALFIVQEINSSTSGSALRKGLMDMLLRSLKAIADRSQPGDVSLLSDKDLDREMVDLAQRMLSEGDDHPDDPEPDPPADDEPPPIPQAPKPKAPSGNVQKEVNEQLAG